MPNALPKPKPPYRPAPPVSSGQTLLWFLGGLAVMFAVISAVFALKLGLEGRLFVQKNPEPVVALGRPAAEATDLNAQPVAESPASPATGSEFAGGAENIIPPEAAHLNKQSSALNAVKAPAPATEAQPTSGDPLSPVLMAWAEAWENKNADAYLAYYAPDFKAANGLSTEVWKDQRRQRLGKAGEISVKLSDIQISLNGDKATVRFIQTYTADKHSVREARITEFVHRNGRWLIQAEALDN